MTSTTDPSGSAPASEGPLARRYLWALAVALATACLVALAEIDAQSARMVDSQGRAWPFSVLVGPGAVERRAGWTEVLGAGGLIADPLFRALLGWYAAVGLVLVITCGCLLAGLVALLYRSRGGRRWAGCLVGLWVVSAVVRDLTLLVLTGVRGPSAWTGVLWAATTVRGWLLVAVGAALLLRFVIPQPAATVVLESPRAAASRVLRALVHHRFSVAMIVPLIVLTMLSGSAILEQLPDVEGEARGAGIDVLPHHAEQQAREDRQDLLVGVVLGGRRGRGGQEP